MIEKIKRKKKVNDQDKQQPNTIQDLIRRYDLDNVKEDDYLDYLADYLSNDLDIKAGDIQSLKDRATLLETNKAIRDFGSITFQDTTNQKVKITMPITTAIYANQLKVKILTNYNTANYEGFLEKTYSFVSTPTNIFGGGAGEYSYVGNNADLAFAISDAALVNGNIEIVIAFQSNKRTDCKIMLEAYCLNNNSINSIKNATISSIYTTDSSTYPTPVYEFIKPVSPDEGLVGKYYSNITNIERSKVFILPYIPYSQFVSPFDLDEFAKGLLAWICQNYPNVQNGSWIGTVNCGSRAFVSVFIYDTSVVDVDTHLPRYSALQLNLVNGYTINSLGTYDYTYYRYDEDRRFPQTTTNENGTAIRFADGAMICTKAVDFEDTPCTTATGTLYRSGSLNLGNYAQDFIAAPILQLTISNGSAVGWISYVGSVGKSAVGLCQISRSTSTSAATYHIQVTAVGRWK